VPIEISSLKFSKKVLLGMYELLYNIKGFSTLGSVEAVPCDAAMAVSLVSIFFVLKNEDVD